MNDSFCAVRIVCEDEPVTIDQDFLEEQVRLEAVAIFA